MRRSETSGRLRTAVAVLASLLVTALLLAVAVLGPGRWWATPPIAAPEPVVADPAVRQQMQQAALVAAEDERLQTVVRAIPWDVGPYIDPGRGTPVLVLPNRPAAYGLADLISFGAARTVAPGVVAVGTDVLVAPGGRLVLDAAGTEIRLTGTRSVTAWRSDLVLRGAPGNPVSVTGWDDTTQAVDRDVTDGRAHLRVLGGNLDVADVELAGLGFWSGRTGGLAVTGVTGDPGSAKVRSTVVRDGWYGLYADDSAAVTVEDARFTGSGADGVRLHRGVHDATVRRVVVERSAGSGVAIGRGATDVSVTDVTTSAGTAGVSVDGAPLADGPGPSGASPGGFAAFRLERVVSRGDREVGVVVDGGSDVMLDAVSVAGAREGVVVRGAARDVRVLGARVSGPVETGIAVRNGASVDVSGSTVDGAGTGVAVRDATARVLGTTVTGAHRHAVRVAGVAHGTEIRDNRLGGGGPSAVDVAQVAPGVAVTVAANDESGWNERRDLGAVVSTMLTHSMLPVWLAVAGLILAVGLRSRLRRRPAPGGSAYPGRPAPAEPELAVRSSGRVQAGPRVTVLERR